MSSVPVISVWLSVVGGLLYVAACVSAGRPLDGIMGFGCAYWCLYAYRLGRGY